MPVMPPVPSANFRTQYCTADQFSSVRIANRAADEEEELLEATEEEPIVPAVEEQQLQAVNSL